MRELKVFLKNLIGGIFIVLGLALTVPSTTMLIRATDTYHRSDQPYIAVPQRLAAPSEELVNPSHIDPNWVQVKLAYAGFYAQLSLGFLLGGLILIFLPREAPWRP